MFRVEHLSVRYATATILDDLTFTVANNSLTAIIGPSGIGKSTLLKAVMHQLPFQGELLLNDAPLDPKTATIAWVPQDYGLLPWKTVRQNIEIGLQVRQHQRLSAIQQQQVTDLLDQLALTSQQAQYPNAISGGQQQRTALARAFLLEPDLLLLDEAFSALDPGLKHRAHQLFMRQWTQHPCPTLMVTHDMTEAIQMSDMLLALSDHKSQLIANPFRDLPWEQRQQAPEFAEVVSQLNTQVGLC